MGKLAVIDLGSNTFHLLIVEVEHDGKFTEIFRQRIFTGLGEGGIDIIKPDAIERGLTACIEFKKHLHINQCEVVTITGTAALRTAKNSAIFIRQAEDVFEKKIIIIDGHREAELIFKGVKLLNPVPNEESFLIMDIGGGSTEFIIAKKGQIQWSKSYKLGVGVLHAGWHTEEPIAPENQTRLRNHINETLAEFYAQCCAHKPEILIGASGSFEVLESMTGKVSSKYEINEIDKSLFYTISQKLIKASDKERLAMEGLPIERAKLIVVAMILLEEVIHAIKPTRLLVSPFALKEGILSEMINLL